MSGSCKEDHEKKPHGDPRQRGSHKIGKAVHIVLSPSMFLFFLLLPERKLSFCLCLFLLPAFHFSFLFILLQLHLQGLLGFCSDTGTFQLLSCAALTPLWVVCRLPEACFNSGTEFQLIVVLENELPHLIVLRLCAESDLAGRQRSVVRALKNADPEGIVEENRQLCFLG